MFYLGILIALVGGLVSIALTREKLKQRHKMIGDYHLDYASVVLLLIGLIISVVEHYQGEAEFHRLQERVSPRHISVAQRDAMLPVLAALTGRRIAVAYRMMDGESSDYATELAGVLAQANCQVPELIKTSLNDLQGYVAVVVYRNADKKDADVLLKALQAAGIPARIEAIEENTVGLWYPDTVHAIVGRKSP